VRDDWVVPARMEGDAVIGYVSTCAERRRVPVKSIGGYAIGAVNWGDVAGSSLPDVDVAKGEVEEVLVTEHWKCSVEDWY